MARNSGGLTPLCSGGIDSSSSISGGFTITADDGVEVPEFGVFVQFLTVLTGFISHVLTFFMLCRRPNSPKGVLHCVCFGSC